MLIQYLDEVERLLNKVKSNEQTLTNAASILANTLEKEGIIHIFGCGHSHIISEEIFYRAGGLACVNPILIEDLMLFKGPVRSSMLERVNNFIEVNLEKYQIQENDVFIVVSTSGINPVPIDAALYAKSKGAQVIALTSLDFSKHVKSRHIDQKRLHEVVDLVIDNYTPIGDAVMTDDRLQQPFGPTSTIINTAIINSVIVETINILLKKNIKPPIFLSGNVQGSDIHNQDLINQYKDRVTHLL
ncbi:SIS domain-containing protein [Cytobacillus sp. IB215316]|uniref:SIS domain-containing protein n=1 Tax=Cytobacillus sp. IB215316 TaxID=3097354 RepID=UPI002A10C00E|nr:SIS domain-containing protein [Cytobacillus sp. IB215316]MDX8360826.1 SIS domain-containing protein [Cytobacillus sp. IB215316]